MQAEILEILFKQHGYILVIAPLRYHAFRPEDIQDDKVREGACPVATITWNVIDTLSYEQAERFLHHCEHLPWNAPSFDTTQPYRIGLQEKPLPEWHGWPIGELRKVFGIDK